MNPRRIFFFGGGGGGAGPSKCFGGFWIVVKSRRLCGRA